MLFTFPSATIASISGAALVATLSSRDVAASASFPSKPFKSSFGSFGARSAALGNECSTLKALRVNPDIGILRCEPDGVCVEDASSSIGGRCVAHDEAETLVDVTPGVQSLVLSGIPCTFTNGTEGFKCVGKDACPTASNETVGCGSCIGDYTCYSLTDDVTIGENSCVGFAACDMSRMPSVVVGDNSCIGLLACINIDGNVTIGDNSCIGYFPCMSVNGTASSTNIGSNSCHYNEACKYLEGTVGNDSCIGTYSCYEFNGGTIGDGSCSSYGACGQFRYFQNTGNIGDNSCNGKYTCNFMVASRNTGDNSCNGDYACAAVKYDVGYNSCNGYRACPTCYQSAQKVKLQSVTGDPIQVFEVKVYSSGVNVAEGKTAEQSSTYKGKSKFGASNAIDGDENTFSHTIASSTCSSWWEVDLGGMFPIESVEILNRWCKEESDPTACLCRLSHASLALFDDQGHCVESISIGDTCGELEVQYNFTRSSEYCSISGPAPPPM